MPSFTVQISRNETAIPDSRVVDLILAERSKVMADFELKSTGDNASIDVELHHKGGFIRPGLLSVWVDHEQPKLDELTASISHELVHYELQIDCLINPGPSSFVNEGVAQSYAEGHLMRSNGRPYADAWAALALEDTWQSKIDRAMNDDRYFLNQRMEDRVVGLGNAALWEWLLASQGCPVLRELFRGSKPDSSCAPQIEELTGIKPIEILKSMLTDFEHIATPPAIPQSAPNA